MEKILWKKKYTMVYSWLIFLPTIINNILMANNRTQKYSRNLLGTPSSFKIYCTSNLDFWCAKRAWCSGAQVHDTNDAHVPERFWDHKLITFWCFCQKQMCLVTHFHGMHIFIFSLIFKTWNTHTLCRSSFSQHPKDGARIRFGGKFRGGIEEFM